MPLNLNVLSTWIYILPFSFSHFIYIMIIFQQNLIMKNITTVISYVVLVLCYHIHNGACNHPRLIKHLWLLYSALGMTRKLRCNKLYVLLRYKLGSILIIKTYYLSYSHCSLKTQNCIPVIK